VVLAAVTLLPVALACGGGSERSAPQGARPPRTSSARRPPARTSTRAIERRERTSQKSGGGSDAKQGKRSYDPSRPDGPGNDKPPPPGSPSERFEKTCEKNPQDCY
jgi:hypothetical protein